MKRVLLLVLCLILSVCVANSVPAQSFGSPFGLSAEYCLSRSDYISRCAVLTPLHHCSQEMTRTCCGCEGVWGGSFSYCGFKLNLVPTPSPVSIVTPTPSPIPSITPAPYQPPIGGELPGIVIKDGVTCRVRVSHTESSCSDGEVRVGFDARESSGSGSWRYDCGSGGAGDLGDGLAAVLPVSEPSPGVETRCNVYFTTNGITCGAVVLINSCALGCLSYYNYAELLTLDGGAAKQRAEVVKATKLMRRVKIKTKEIRVLLSKAGKLYERSWQLTWSVPILFKSCTNNVACVNASHGDALSEYEDNAHALDKLVRDSIRKIRSKARRNKAIIKSANVIQKASTKLLKDILAERAKLPDVRSSCTPGAGGI